MPNPTLTAIELDPVAGGNLELTTVPDASYAIGIQVAGDPFPRFYWHPVDGLKVGTGGGTPSAITAAAAANAVLIAASDSPAKWKTWAGVDYTAPGTNDGAFINAVVGTIPGAFGLTALSPLTAPKFGTVIYAPGTYNVSSDAILMRTGVTHKSFGGAQSTFIKGVAASCRGLFMLYDGNVHAFGIDGFTLNGNFHAGSGDGIGGVGLATIKGLANGLWIDHRIGTDSNFLTENPSAPASGFQSTNYTGQNGLWAGKTYAAGTAYVVGNCVKDAGIFYVCIQAGTGHTPASSPTFWTVIAAEGSGVDWNGTAYITTLVNTSGSNGSHVSNISGGNFTVAKYNADGTLYTRRFAGFFRDSSGGNAPVGNTYMLTNWSCWSACDGVGLEISGCGDGEASNIQIGGTKLDYAFVFRCASWRFSNLKGYFGNGTGGLLDTGGRNSYDNCHMQDFSVGYAFEVTGSGVAWTTCSSDSCDKGWRIGASSQSFAACNVLNRSGGNAVTVEAVTLSSNRTGIMGEINATDLAPLAAYAGGTTYAVGDGVSSGGITYRCIQAGAGNTPASSPTFWTPWTPYILEGGAAPTGNLRIVNGGAVTRFGPGRYTPTAVKTASYTAKAGEFVPVHTVAADVVITLPTAPADETLNGAGHVQQDAANTVTLTAAGSDVINVAGTTTKTVALGAAVKLQYNAAGAVWYIV